MKRWAAILVFIFFSIMEFLDLAGLVSGISQPGLYEVSSGLRDQEGLFRLLILSIFSLGIGIVALLTATGIFRRKSYSHITAGITAILFISYGWYQIASAIIQLTSNQIGVVTAGIIFILFGVIASWLGNQTKLGVQDVPRQ